MGISNAIIKTKLRLLLVAACFFAVSGCKSQQRSTTVQVFDGKKYYIHKIEKKQSVYGISRLYGVPIDEIYRENPELLDGAKIGQEIRVPVVETVAKEAAPAGPDTSRFIVHKVAKGETVYSISRRYNLTGKQLTDLNPGTENGLRENQLLIVGEKKKKTGTAPETVQVITVPEKPDVIDSSLFLPMHKPAKPVYNVALMLPFALDSTANLDPVQLAKTRTGFPAATSGILDFYLGFKKAADSLSSTGFKANLRLYDINEADTLHASRLMSDTSFLSTDLIIGPLSPVPFKLVSEKAAEQRIPVVSPFTQQNKILFNNIYVSKTSPSVFTVMETLADYCIDSLLPQGATFLLVAGERDRREAVFTQAFKKYFNERTKSMGRMQDSVRVARGFEGVKQLYKPNTRHVIITLSANQVFIADLTTQLAMFADKKDITLCGWQMVSVMENIDLEYLNQLRFTFPHQYNTANVDAYKPLNEYYKNRIGIYPGEQYYVGFDIGWYYLSQLKSTGPDFVHNLDALPMETNYMRFRFHRPDKVTGFDNRGIFIIRYDKYELVKTGWK